MNIDHGIHDDDTKVGRGNLGAVGEEGVDRNHITSQGAEKLSLLLSSFHLCFTLVCYLICNAGCCINSTSQLFSLVYNLL